MNRVAVCLYGLYNHHFNDAGQKGFEQIREQILSKVIDADIFCHSWSTENREVILSNYKPKKWIIEDQIDFSHNVDALDLDYFLTTRHRDRLYLFRAFSFYYTRAKAILLKKQYEEEMGFKYDSVISCRFDLGQRDRNWTGKYFVSRINFDSTLDMSNVHSAMWDQLNAGMADQWFYSNSHNMDRFIEMYDALPRYLTRGSEYEKAVTEGWFDSNYFECNNPSDPRHYTNELLFREDAKSKNLMKYPVWECVNNHIIHKWFLKEIGLYEKSRYLVGEA